MSVLATGCGNIETDRLTSAMFAYTAFLNGETGVREYESIADMAGEGEKIGYALFDMTNDGIPELHVHSAWGLHILSYEEDLTIWKAYGNSTLLRNGAILHLRDAPIMKNRAYKLLNFNGDTVYGIRFEEVEFSKEEKRYIFDGVEISEALWNKLTARYLFVEETEWEELQIGEQIGLSRKQP
jgi:hypothetical protein